MSVSSASSDSSGSDSSDDEGGDTKDPSVSSFCLRDGWPGCIIRGVNHSLEISGNSYNKSEISYA